MKLVCRCLGLSDYETVWQRMRTFTDKRDAGTPDEVWLLEHHPVFTLGQAAKLEHLIAPGDIPVVRTDRGGQVTYHGPGQLVVYLLLDIRRLKLTVRDLVSGIEQSVIDLLRDYSVDADTDRKAPGVYVAGRKIAALGLRLRRGCSFHGFSFNVDMDCEPYGRINPCGYEGLEVAQLRDFGIKDNIHEVSDKLMTHMKNRFGYDLV